MFIRVAPVLAVIPYLSPVFSRYKSEYRIMNHSLWEVLKCKHLIMAFCL